jgi:3-hydroxybutyryl-CoA dehydrogenase
MDRVLTVDTVAVIGAGAGAVAGGRAIAQRAALGGYRTILEDILPASLRHAQSEISSYLNQAVEDGTARQAEAETALRRLEYVGTVEAAAREAELVIEAVPDELESKLEIFLLLDKICKPHTLLASTTRTLSIAEIASVTYRPGKIMGMCFPQPIIGGNALQLVRTPQTESQTVIACVDVGRRMGLEVVVIVEASHLT